MDRNYGGVFIFWDRLFGSFQEELDCDPPISRPWALKLEGLRLAANLPLMAIAQVMGLWSVTSLGWIALLTYTALSAITVYCARGRLIRLAGS